MNEMSSKDLMNINGGDAFTWGFEVWGRTIGRSIERRKQKKSRPRKLINPVNKEYFKNVPYFSACWLNRKEKIEMKLSIKELEIFELYEITGGSSFLRDLINDTNDAINAFKKGYYEGRGRMRLKKLKNTNHFEVC